MYFQRGDDMPKGSGHRTRAALRVENQRQKEELVNTGRAHGILVYLDDEPIGWCQFGRSGELPCGYIRRDSDDTSLPDWRITCFVTDKRYRGRGVAQGALRAAVHAIQRSGGGLVEGYPVAGWTRGPEAIESTARIPVDGVGGVVPARGTFGFVSTQGTLSMFALEGFTAVGVVEEASRQKVSGRPPESHVIVRRELHHS